MIQEHNRGTLPPITKRMTPGIVAIVVTVLAFIPYALTLSPTFGFVDKGEMVAVASSLGIAHPTGYPTIMLLGRLFTLLLPVRDVLALNIMAALLTASSVGVLSLLLQYIMSRTGIVASSEKKGKGKKKRKGEKGEQRERDAVSEAGTSKSANPPADPVIAILAGLAALLAGYAATWWNQGNSFEVYSLHTLMLPLVTLLFLKYVDGEVRTETILEGGGQAANGFTRKGVFFSVALGLSFTNHLTTVLLAPAFLIYYFWTLGVTRQSFLRLLYLIPGFIVGLLPYLWLPIRASMSPRFNWGNPETLKAFIDHVTGKQYRVWMFTNPDTFYQQTRYFLSSLPSEIAYAGLLLVILGIVWLTRKSMLRIALTLALISVCVAVLLFAGQRMGGIGYVVVALALIAVLIAASFRTADSMVRLNVVAAAMFITCLGYAGGFDIMEIGPYYLTAVFAIAIWCGAGLMWVKEQVGRSGALGLPALLVVVNVAVNYTESDEKGNMLVEDMTVNMLTTLPKNALIFSSQWDFWVSGSWYMQGVEKMREDVLVIDQELVRRSWYLDELVAVHPEFMAHLEPEFTTFREQLYKFEHGLPYDGYAIETAYIGLINAMIDKSIAHRPVFVTGEVEMKFGGKYRRVPNHLALRLISGEEYVPQEFPQYRFQFWDGEISGYTAKASELYARSAHARSLYESGFGNDSLAQRYYDLALSFDPGYTMDDVPVLPLNSEEQVTGLITYFDQLRRGRPN